MLSHIDLVNINYKFFIMKKIKVIENSRFLSNDAMNEVHGGGEILCPGRTDYLVCKGKFTPPPPCMVIAYSCPVPTCDEFIQTPIDIPICWKFS